MRRRSARIIASTVMLSLAACSSERPRPQTDMEGLPATTVRVTVRGLQSHEGRVLLAMFAAPDGFPGEPQKATRHMELTIEGDAVEFTIEGVAAGMYALSVIHDENGSGTMETGWFGRPSEAYGFSRDARGRFGPPSFDDAMFEVRGQPVNLEINLSYP